jgi:transposase
MAKERKERTPRLWTEQDIAAALDDIRSGTSVRKVALKWKIPAQTLSNRIKGRTKPRQQAHGAQQRLSPDQEAVLVTWIQLWADTARPISISRIQRIARDLAGGKVGKNWVYRFLQRHPQLKLGKPLGLDPKRAQAFNEAIVRKHYEELAKALYPGLNPSNLYNMDEKGCQRGGGRRIRNQKFITRSDKTVQYRIQSANLELITIIECVAADGANIKPGFVFPQKRSSLEENWINVDPDIGYVVDKTGDLQNQ